MSLPIMSSALSTALKECLYKAEVVDSSVLLGLKIAELAKLLKVPPNEAAAYKREIGAAFGGRPLLQTQAATVVAHSALELMQQTEKTGIVTFCKELDSLLLGGIPLGEVTEICGVPGIGKTQLSMQAVLDVQIPAELGGVEGEAVYVDTEGSLMPARVAQMANSLEKHLLALVQRRHADNTELLAKVTDGCSAGRLLEGIHVYRCTDLAEQTAAIMGLAPFLDAHPRVRIIVVDSLAFHYRYMDTDMPARSRHLQQMAQQMHRLAATYNVAVLVVNQMTTKVDAAAGNGASLEGALADGTLVAALPPEARKVHAAAVKLFPALGEVWAHACTNRLLLGWVPPPLTYGGAEAFVRAAQLVKSPSRAPGIAHFGVAGDGIRGLRKLPAATPSPSPESGLPASPWVSGAKRSAAAAHLDCDERAK